MFGADLSTRQCGGHFAAAFARHAGADLLLAAPQRQGPRVLTPTRLIDVFPVHASLGEAAGSAGRSLRAAGPPAGSPIFFAVT